MKPQPNAAAWTRTDNLAWPATAIPLDLDDDWA